MTEIAWSCLVRKTKIKTNTKAKIKTTTKTVPVLTVSRQSRDYYCKERHEERNQLSQARALASLALLYSMCVLKKKKLIVKSQKKG